MSVDVSNSPEQLMAALRQEFLRELPARIRTIERHLQNVMRGQDWQNERESLHRSVHSLIGAAGTYGMRETSDCARDLQARLNALTSDRATAPGETSLMESSLAALKQSISSYQDTEHKAPSRHANPRHESTPLVCLVDDDPDMCNSLTHWLHSANYRVKSFSDCQQFRAWCEDPETVAPDAIIMDMVFPDRPDGGARLLEGTKCCFRGNVPVVMLSQRNDLESRLLALRAGAGHYLRKPVLENRLVTLLDEITGKQAARPYRVLLVDDDTDMLKALTAILESAGLTVSTCTRALDTQIAIEAFRPDVVVLDLHMPEASGPELAAILREHEDYQHIPVLFLSAESDNTQQLQAMNQGGDGFLVKPVAPQQLITAVTSRARRTRNISTTLARLEDIIYERERERLAVDHHAIISIADRNGDIIYVNNKFCELSGFKREELLGRNHRIVKSDAHPESFYQALWRTISSGNIWQGEICNRAKDGSLYWVESTITPFMDTEGKPYQYVSIRTDITHVKNAEIALSEQKERLRRGQSYANIGTWEWNVQSDELFWSERIPVLFGYAEGQLETNYTNFLNAVHPDDRQSVEAAIQRSLLHRWPYEVEHRVVWPDGTVRWLLEKGAVVTDRNGQAELMVGVVQDIHERKMAEDALIVARGEAEAANQAKTEFLSNMSHELRTPMNAILGFGQLMALDEQLGGMHKEHIGEIMKAGNHLLTLINQVLDLSRVESGHLHLDTEAVSIPDLVRECVALMYSLAREKNVRINSDELGTQWVQADRTRLKQAILNLLSNAIKYNQPGGSVTLYSKEHGNDRIRLFVDDTGIGISPEQRHELFKPFSRIHNQTHQVEGTGIGLSITRTIMQAMDGEIDMRSTPGKGSSFWLELPAHQSSSVVENRSS